MSATPGPTGEVLPVPSPLPPGGVIVCMGGFGGLRRWCFFLRCRARRCELGRGWVGWLALCAGLAPPVGWDGAVLPPPDEGTAVPPVEAAKAPPGEASAGAATPMHARRGVLGGLQ